MGIQSSTYLTYLIHVENLIVILLRNSVGVMYIYICSRTLLKLYNIQKNTDKTMKLLTTYYSKSKIYMWMFYPQQSYLINYPNSLMVGNYPKLSKGWFDTDCSDEWLRKGMATIVKKT